MVDKYKVVFKKVLTFISNLFKITKGVPNRIKSYNKAYSKEYYLTHKEDKLNYSRDYYIQQKQLRLSNNKVVKDLF